MKLKNVAIFFVCASVFFKQQTGNAQSSVTYLNNTGQPITGTADIDSNLYLTAQFLTGTNAGGYIINSVQFLFADASGSPNLTSYLRCDLCSSIYDLPQSVLDTFVPNDNPTTAGLHTFERLQPLDSPVNLAAATDYWLLFIPSGNSSVGEYRYSLTDSANSVANDGWSITGNVWNGQVGLPMFTINATAIPEPSSVSLCFSMVLTAACHRRFRR